MEWRSKERGRVMRGGQGESSKASTVSLTRLVTDVDPLANLLVRCQGQHIHPVMSSKRVVRGERPPVIRGEEGSGVRVRVRSSLHLPSAPLEVLVLKVVKHHRATLPSQQLAVAKEEVREAAVHTFPTTMLSSGLSRWSKRRGRQRVRE